MSAARFTLDELEAMAGVAGLASRLSTALRTERRADITLQEVLDVLADMPIESFAEMEATLTEMAAQVEARSDAGAGVVKLIISAVMFRRAVALCRSTGVDPDEIVGRLGGDL